MRTSRQLETFKEDFLDCYLLLLSCFIEKRKVRKNEYDPEREEGGSTLDR